MDNVNQVWVSDDSPLREPRERFTNLSGIGDLRDDLNLLNETSKMFVKYTEEMNRKYAR